MFKQLTHPLVRTALAVAAVLGLLTLGQAVLAGNVDSVNKYAWSTNAGWVNLQPANLQPTNGGVVVHGDHLDGYAWGTNVGWINFDPTNGGVTIDPVTGAFSGDAWGENIGWVRFRGAAQNGTDYGVNAEPCTAVLTVTKALDPTSDDGCFVMEADGVAGDQLGHGAQVTVTVGVGATAYFTETAGADTALSNYATEYRCDDPSATSGVTANGSLTMPSVDVTCIFTNTRRVDTVESTTGVGPVTYSVDNCAIDTFDAVAESSLPNAGKPSVDFVYGFFGLKLVGCPIGGTANVTIELPTNLPTGSEFWKYQGSWFEYPFGSDDGDNIITIALTDGAVGDADGVANGEIVDPAGPGTPVAPEVILTESYGVSSVTEGQLTGEGSIACYWVTLNVQPGADVIVDVASQKGQLDVSPKMVTLNTANWDNLTLNDRTNFVCMRATDNKIDDSGAEVCKQKQRDILGQSGVEDGVECGDNVDYLIHTVSSSDPTFDKLTAFVSNGLQDLDNNPSTVDGLIRDNDATAVSFTESYAVSDLDESGAPVGVACYWVNLTTIPNAPVTVNVLPDDVHVRANKRTVTLDASNWDRLDAAETANKVCLTPLDDDIINPVDPHCVLSNQYIFGGGPDGTQVCGSYLSHVNHTVSSADGRYNNTQNFVTNGPNLDDNLATVDVLLRDDNIAAVLLNPAQLNVVEGGSADVGLTLSSRPAAPVMVRSTVVGAASAASLNDENSQQVTFDSSNWDQAQTMTIQIPENDSADGVHEELIELNVASGDVNFQGIQVEPVHVVVVDNDAAGIARSSTQLALREHGGESSYQLSLTSEPSADLTVEMITGDQVTVNPSAVTFTPANWQAAQTATVRAVDDAQVEAHGHVGLIRHTVASGDVAYNGIQVSDVGAAIEDNDAVGLTSNGADGLAVSEGGAGRSYGLKLSSRPAGDVTVALSGGGQLMVEPASLTFTSANWNAEQTVSVMALDDAIDEDDTHVGLVSYSLSGDPTYAGLPVLEQSVTIADDDTAGISLSVTALEVTRSGAGSYEVSLTSQPQAAVLVELRPSGGVRLAMPTCDGGDEQGACLVFNGENWNQPQTVTVRASAAGQVVHEVISGDDGYDDMVTSAVDVSLIEGGISVFLPLVNK